MYRNLPIDKIRECPERYNWTVLTRCRRFDTPTLHEFNEYINWRVVSLHYNMDDYFILEFHNRLDWRILGKRRYLSARILERFCDRLNGFDIALHQAMADPLFTALLLGKPDYRLLQSMRSRSLKKKLEAYHTICKAYRRARVRVLKKELRVRCPSIYRKRLVLDEIVYTPDIGIGFRDLVKKYDNLKQYSIKEMKINILYTYDMHDVYTTKMLKLSILSVIREFKSVINQIYIYSTKTESLVNELEAYRDHVTICPLDISGLESALGCNYSKLGVNTVCPIYHARMLLIPKLLAEEKRPVLYMDCDTGIQLGRGGEVIEFFKKQTLPIGNALEPGTIKDLCKKMDQPVFDPSELTTDGHTYALTSQRISTKPHTYALDGKVINNGVAYFPITNKTLEMALEMLDLYLAMMRTDNPNGMCDMFSFSCVLTRHKITYLERGEEMWSLNGYGGVNVNPTEYDNAPASKYITHYYFQKMMYNSYVRAFLAVVDILEKPILAGYVGNAIGDLQLSYNSIETIVYNSLEIFEIYKVNHNYFANYKEMNGEGEVRLPRPFK
jgi:hypothetical protein